MISFKTFEHSMHVSMELIPSAHLYCNTNVDDLSITLLQNLHSVFLFFLVKKFSIIPFHPSELATLSFYYMQERDHQDYPFYRT